MGLGGRVNYCSVSNSKMLTASKSKPGYAAAEVGKSPISLNL